MLPKVIERTRDLSIGPGDADGVEMGPLVTEGHRDRVAGYIDAGESEGAEVVLDGRGFKVDGHENGFFLGATLLDRVTPAMSVYRDEIFGPVLSVVRVDRYEDAIRMVNENPFGNGTAVLTAP